MLKESIRNLVLAIAEGDTLAIEDSFNSVMASKISDRLDDMRVDVAQGMFGSVDESYDSSDAYETWDPKHPKFKEKLIKHQKNGGTTKSFIEKEKAKAWKKLTRESYDLEDYSVDESTNWAAHNAKTSARKEASPEELHAEFKKYANNPGHHYYKGKFSDDKDGGKTAEQKAITNIALGIGKADKQNYAARISHLIKPKATNEELTLEDYSVEELEDFMMSEEFEQLDEISKKTLGSYVNKAHDQLMKHTASVNFKSGRGDSDVLSYTHEPRTARKTANRTKGVATAIGKLTKEEFTLEDYSVEELEDFMMSEEFEQLDELSKKTLANYVHAASQDAQEHSYDAGENSGQRGNPTKKMHNQASHDASIDKVAKRNTGMYNAIKKLTK